jgi:hypothetical protein
MRRLSVFASVSATALLLAGCVAPSQPAPRPAPPVAVPTIAPPAPPPPKSADWRDWPLTPGNWSYRPDERGSVALFGVPGQEAGLSLRCDRTRSRIAFSRPGLAAGVALTVRTTSLVRSLTVMTGAGYPAAELGARDALLDAMGYSRGRLLIEGAGLPTLVVPAWAEILRVAEDCRG